LFQIQLGGGEILQILLNNLTDSSLFQIQLGGGEI